MTTPDQNAYATLNLRKGANDQEIKMAYVEMVKRYDPEKHTEQFMRIQKAYECLRDPKKRAHEDVFAYNYARGEFLFTDEEKTDEPLPDVLGRIKQLEEQFKQDPKNPAAKPALIANYMKRSYRNTQKRLWTEAMKDWIAILHVDPTNQRAKNNLLFSYVYLGYYYAVHDLQDEAINLWENSLKMDPENRDVIHNMALALEKAGKPQDAQRYWGETIKHWKSELDKNPNDEYFRNCLIEVHKHHGGKAMESVQTPETKQEAVEQYREILKINPSDFEAQYNIAQALMDEGKYEEAISQLKQLQTQHPKNMDIVNLLGWAYLNGGKFEMAFNTWRRGLIMDPKNFNLRESIVRARLAVGKKLKNGGHYTQALVHFKELQKIMPNQWEVHMEIGECLDRKGDKRSALVEYQRVLDIDPKNKVAKKAIADIRMRS